MCGVVAVAKLYLTVRTLSSDGKTKSAQHGCDSIIIYYILYILYIIMYFGKERKKVSFKDMTINPLELLNKDTFTVTEESSDRVLS